MTNLVSPFTVANSAIHVSIAGFNNEPLKVRGKNNLLRAFKPRSYRHTVINSAGTLTSFASNAAYSMTDSDVYLNSGWLLPGRTRTRISWIFKYTPTIYQYGTYTYTQDASISHRKIAAVNRPALKNPQLFFTLCLQFHDFSRAGRFLGPT